MTPLDYIETARDLVATHTTGRPRETNLRRAVSTTYYALFHCVAASNANLLVGGPRSDHSRSAWRQAYRALDHRQARQRCENQRVIDRFPVEIRNFASLPTTTPLPPFRRWRS